METVNEILLQIIAWHMLISAFRTFFKTDSSSTEESTETFASIAFDNVLGWSMIYSIVLLQVINVTVIVISTIKDVIWKIHICKLKKQREVRLSKVVQLDLHTTATPVGPTPDNFVRSIPQENPRSD